MKVFRYHDTDLTYICKRRLKRYKRKKFLLEIRICPYTYHNTKVFHVCARPFSFDREKLKYLLEDYNGKIYFTIPISQKSKPLYGLTHNRPIPMKYYKKYNKWFYNSGDHPTGYIVFDTLAERNLFKLSY